MGSSQNGAWHAVSLTHSPPGAQAGPEPISIPSHVPSARQTRAACGSCARGMRLAPTERGWLSKTFYEQKKSTSNISLRMRSADYIPKRDTSHFGSIEVNKICRENEGHLCVLPFSFFFFFFKCDHEKSCRHPGGSRWRWPEVPVGQLCPGEVGLCHALSPNLRQNMAPGVTWIPTAGDNRASSPQKGAFLSALPSAAGAERIGSGGRSAPLGGTRQVIRRVRTPHVRYEETNSQGESQ